MAHSKLCVQRKIDESLLDAVMTRRRFGREAITAMRIADTAAPRQGNGDGWGRKGPFFQDGRNNNS